MAGVFSLPRPHSARFISRKRTRINLTVRGHAISVHDALIASREFVGLMVRRGSVVGLDGRDERRNGAFRGFLSHSTWWKMEGKNVWEENDSLIRGATPDEYDPSPGRDTTLPRWNSAVSCLCWSSSSACRPPWFCGPSRSRSRRSSPTPTWRVDDVVACGPKAAKENETFMNKFPTDSSTHNNSTSVSNFDNKNILPIFVLEFHSSKINFFIFPFQIYFFF